MMPNFVLMIVGDEKAMLGSAIEISPLLWHSSLPRSQATYYKMYIVFGPRLLYILVISSHAFGKHPSCVDGGFVVSNTPRGKARFAHSLE